MMGRIVKNWDAVNFRDKNDVKKVIGALNHFLAAPDRPDVRAALQHFTTAGNFPAEARALLEKTLLLEPVDLAYESIFDVRPFQNTRASGFKLAATGSALVFDEVKTGEKARVYQASGSEVFVDFVKYGAGLNWDNTLIEDGSYWVMEDNLQVARAQFFAKRAETFYALIEAISSGLNVAWQAPTPAALANTDPRYIMSRDANTIHAAALAIMTSMKQYGVGPNSPLVILAPLALKQRINMALAFGEPMANGQRVLDWNLSTAFTQNLSSQSVYYVCAPKLSAKGGYRQDLSVKFDEDILADASVMAAFGRWGAGIGNANQFRRCATA